MNPIHSRPVSLSLVAAGPPGANPGHEPPSWKAVYGPCHPSAHSKHPAATDKPHANLLCKKTTPVPRPCYWADGSRRPTAQLSILPNHRLVRIAGERGCVTRTFSTHPPRLSPAAPASSPFVCIKRPSPLINCSRILPATYSSLVPWIKRICPEAGNDAIRERLPRR